MENPDVKKGVVSSSIGNFVKKVAEKLGRDFWRANSTFVFDKRVF